MFTNLFRRLTNAIQRRKQLRELQEEMDLHLDLRTEKLQAGGMDPNAAREAAKRRFGNRTSITESIWDFWSFNTLESFWRDLWFGARVLRSNPAFTAIAIGTLALGIGAATAMFSVIDNVLLNPFPYAHSGRLYNIAIHDLSSNQAGVRTLMPPDELLDYKDRNRVFEDVMGVGISRALWRTSAGPESVNAPLVTPNAFEFLGVKPLLGRLPLPTDTGLGKPGICAVSYAFWRNRLGSDPNLIGKILWLDDAPRRVVAVMPPRFVFWSGDVWLPTPLIRTGSVQPPWFYSLARAKPGVSISTADADVKRIAKEIAPTYMPNLYTNRFEIRLRSFIEDGTRTVSRTLYTLLAAVGLLFLIACANVASLLLARASARTRELAVRSSLGAGWARILRQLFSESLLLAASAAVCGCALAWAGLKLLVAILPADTFPDEAIVALNGRVLAATALTCFATAIFFGTVPIVSGLRRDIADALRTGGYGHSGARGLVIRRLLIVAQVAVSLVLLSGAGITLRSFLAERETQLGISVQHVVTAQLFLTKNHASVAQQIAFQKEYRAALQRIPGVLSVTATTDFLPFGGAETALAAPTGVKCGQAEGVFAFTDPDFAPAFSIPVLSGRNLNQADIASKRHVAVINRTLAARFFPHQNPIGQRIEVNTLAYLPNPVRDDWFEIVGVLGDFKNHGVREAVAPEALIPYTISGLGGFAVAVKTAGDPAMLERILESAALTINPAVVVRRIRTIQDALEAEVYAKPRFGLRIFAAFAGLGLALVVAGLYSVAAYVAARRRRELGIRIALGATARSVQSMLIRSEMPSIVAGIALGLAGAYASARVLASQVWGVNIHDIPTLATVSSLLLIVGLAAAWIAAATVSRRSPMDSLRTE